MIRRSSMPFRAAAALSWAMAFAPAFPCAAQTSDDDARKHFEAGMSYFKTSDYEGAVREFKKAYELAEPKNRPPILFSLASVYERMGELPKTVETLKSWLWEASPSDKDRGTVELRIKNLEKRLAEHNAVAVSTTPAASSPVASAPSAAPKPAPDAARASSSAPSRTPAYVTWGIGGAALAGALVTGYLAKQKYDDADGGCHQTLQGCSDADIAPIKTMAMVSTVFAGVAVLGAGLGAYFYVAAAPPKQDSAAFGLPRLQAGVMPHGGGVQAAWTF